MKDKINDELLKEVQKLKLENSSLKKLHQKDIADLKQVEKSLLESEERFQLLFNKAPLGYQSLDIDGNFMDIASGKWVSSEVLDKIFGIETDYDKSIEGWAAIVHPEWQKIMTDYFAQEVIGNKTKFDKEYKIIRKNDGAERWVHGLGNLKFNENDQPITMIGTIQDITERKQSESELIRAKEKAEENQELLNLTLEATKDETWDWNSQRQTACYI